MSDWISVKDRLPECICSVMSYAENKPDGFKFGIWHKIPIHPDDIKNANDPCEPKYQWQPYDEVTHWMPLPEPPKQEIENNE